MNSDAYVDLCPSQDNLLSEIWDQLRFGYELKAQKPRSQSALHSVEYDEEPGVFTAFSDSYIFSFDSRSFSASDDELIKTYRQLSTNAEFDFAIREIKNEMFVFDVPGKRAFDIGFVPEAELPDSVKKKITEEFWHLYDNLLNFKKNGVGYFRSWYVDSKLYLLKIVDPEKTSEGIQKIQKIDPLNIVKIKVVPRPDQDGTYDLSQIKEYYRYTSRDNGLGTAKEITVLSDSVTFLNSGIIDETQKTIGFMWKAIVPFNNLKLLEDSAVVYRVTRSPERRVFYIDVSGLSKPRAESYMKELMNRFKTKLVFDSRTGTVVDRKNVMSMVEDYWLPRQEGRGTEIQTLPGGDATRSMDDILYFKTKFYKALNIPMGRVRDEQTSGFVFGKNVEIDREEYRFKKFIDDLREIFISGIFLDCLKSQLLLKNIIVSDDWETISSAIYWTFTEDNNFVEFKESEKINNRLASVQMADNYLGKYFSKSWIMKQLLKLSDEEIKQMNKEIDADKASAPPEESGF